MRNPPRNTASRATPSDVARSRHVTSRSVGDRQAGSVATSCAPIKVAIPGGGLSSRTVRLAEPRVQGEPLLTAACVAASRPRAGKQTGAEEEEEEAAATGGGAARTWRIAAGPRSPDNRPGSGWNPLTAPELWEGGRKGGRAAPPLDPGTCPVPASPEGPHGVQPGAARPAGPGGAGCGSPGSLHLHNRRHL